MTRLARIVLWLFVMNLGVAFGAGLFEHRIVVPGWVSTSPNGERRWNPERVAQDDTGRRFWAFVTTGPLTLLTLASLFLARKAPTPVRQWWFGAAALSLAERAFTFSYFIPTMVGLMNAADSPESVARAARWSNLNYLRHALVLGTWLSALNAFSFMRRADSPRSSASSNS